MDMDLVNLGARFSILAPCGVVRRYQESPVLEE